LYRGRRGGFTLIEILVVVAIIALLISILIPSLSRAREQTKRAVCLANLSTLGKAMIIYADASKDVLPNDNPANSVIASQNGSAQVLIALARKYAPDPGVFHCPMDRDPSPKRIITADYDQPDSARTSYDFYSIWWLPEFGPRLTRIKDAPLAWDLDGGATTPKPDQNHGIKGGNVVHADGHAAWQDVKKWDKENWPHPATKYYRQ